MAPKYQNLDELRRKKQILKNEVNDLQNLITFKNTKESLSAITNGLTDPYLKEEIEADGSTKTALNTQNIIKEVSNSVKDNFNRKSLINFAQTDAGSTVAENSLKMGLAALLGGVANRNLKHSSWKNKLLGLALIYLLPIALKFVRQKLEEYQKNKAASSLEQLI